MIKEVVRQPTIIKQIIQRPAPVQQITKQVFLPQPQITRQVPIQQHITRQVPIQQHITRQVPVQQVQQVQQRVFPHQQKRYASKGTISYVANSESCQIHIDLFSLLLGFGVSKVEGGEARLVICILRN